MPTVEEPRLSRRCDRDEARGVASRASREELEGLADGHQAVGRSFTEGHGVCCTVFTGMLRCWPLLLS